MAWSVSVSYQQNAIWICISKKEIWRTMIDWLWCTTIICMLCPTPLTAEKQYAYSVRVFFFHLVCIWYQYFFNCQRYSRYIPQTERRSTQDTCIATQQWAFTECFKDPLHGTRPQGIKVLMMCHDTYWTIERRNRCSDGLVKAYWIRVIRYWHSASSGRPWLFHHIDL